MIVKMYLIDAFADGLFSGGKAGVAVLRHLGQEIYLAGLAQEMNLPVLAYVLPHNDQFMVRYFTPEKELNSADYAALAVGHALYGAGLAPPAKALVLHERGGRRLIFPAGERKGGHLGLALPKVIWKKLEKELLARILPHLSLEPEEVDGAFLTSSDQLVICCRRQEALNKNVSPAGALSVLPQAAGLTVSGPLELPGLAAYALRSFVRSGELAELPLDLDLHGLLAPYWADKEGGRRLEVHHLAARPSLFWAECRPDGEVRLSGRLNTVFKAEPSLSELTGDTGAQFMSF